MPVPYTYCQCNDSLHARLQDWLDNFFPEHITLTNHDQKYDNWNKYFKGTPRFKLIGKLAEVNEKSKANPRTERQHGGVYPRIQFGMWEGQEKFKSARDAGYNFADRLVQILDVQGQTEIGSVQQHRMTVNSDELLSMPPNVQADIIRVAAEEGRHLYQVIYMLDNERDNWVWTGHASNPGEETIDKLLNIQMGEYRLEAFNITWGNILDAAVYMCLIDLVGKYQLEMQTYSSYLPMSRSMACMLDEEFFHTGTGRGMFFSYIESGAQDKGNYSLRDVQRTFNLWFAYALEMFGDIRGGETNITLGLKAKTNKEVQDEYINEVATQVVRSANRRIAKIREPKRDPKSVDLGDETFYLPDTRFFRRQGIEEVFEPYDVHGNHLNCSPDEYFRYLQSVLPEYYGVSADFERYKEAYRANWRDGHKVVRKHLEFPEAEGAGGAVPM
ncbi:MAG TPA: Phenylacetic acid catabolic protein [candidate division Zixibacteria bacterium]|nr:Phenylacetic acid catabolic protein [candidate division Zixibacteria bacterium]